MSFPEFAQPTWYPLSRSPNQCHSATKVGLAHGSGSGRGEARPGHTSSSSTSPSSSTCRPNGADTSGCSSVGLPCPGTSCAVSGDNGVAAVSVAAVAADGTSGASTDGVVVVSVIAMKIRRTNIPSAIIKRTACCAGKHKNDGGYAYATAVQLYKYVCMYVCRYGGGRGGGFM